LGNLSPVERAALELRLRERSPKELTAYGAWFHEIKTERVVILANAVRCTPGFESWQPDGSPDSLGPLGVWFVARVQTRGRTAAEMETLRQQMAPITDVPDWELTEETFSLAMDVGMYFGEVVLKNMPGTRWDQILKDRRDMDYGQVVIMGFGRVPMNPVNLVVAIAYGVRQGRFSGGRLRELYEIWNRMNQDARAAVQS
jgi:hypothetical protein